MQAWTLPTLLGVYGHQFSLKQLWYAWENLPIVVKRHGRGARGGGAEGGKEGVMERKKVQKETDDFLEVMQLADRLGGVEGSLERSWHPTSSPTRRCLSWTSPLRMWLPPRSIFASEPCVMSGSPFRLKSCGVSRMSMPSSSPMWLRTPVWR